MAIFNLQERTINAKIVYYGPALGGKTTSLKWVHHVLDPRNEIELVSLNTEQDRTLFFDFLPISLGTIEGFRIKLQAFTVPGQVMYNQTRKYVLTGADAVVMVIDSQADQFLANQESLVNLDENLRANGLNPDEIPVVFQYNKRDIDAARSIEELERELNERGVTSYATVAITGEGVFEAFTEIAVQTLDGFVGRELGDSRGSSLATSLRDKLRTQQNEVDPGGTVARPIRSATRRPSSRSLPFAAARELQARQEPANEEEDDLLRQAVNSNLEVANLLSEVHEARQELGRKVEELTTLYETGQSLASAVPEDRVLAELLQAATTGAGTEYGSILSLRSDGRGFVVRELSGFQDDPLTAVVKEDPADAGLLPEPDGEPVLVDRSGRPDLTGELARHESGLREAALVPLDLEDDRRSLLVVYRMGPRAPSLAERIPFLRAVVAQAKIAAENARLLARIEGFNRELERTVEERTRDLHAALTELRALDGLKDAFLSSISHELLTPLTSICSFTEILLEHDGTPTEERREFLSIIRGESERLAGKVRDVLDLTHIEAGQAVFRPEDVEVRPLLNEVFDALKEKILARKIRVKITQGRRPPRAIADPGWLARVLRHLIQNAVQWSPAGGAVGIRFVTEGDALRISVVDEGPGIPAADHERVFDRFKQLGDVTTEKPAGIGLGLPLARAIVEKLGGRIALAGEPGRGTEVTVTLPASADGSAAAAEPARDALRS